MRVLVDERNNHPTRPPQGAQPDARRRFEIPGLRKPSVCKCRRYSAVSPDRPVASDLESAKPVADVNPIAYRFHLADIERAARPRGRHLPHAAPLAARVRAVIRDLMAWRRQQPARIAPPSQPG